MIPRVYLDNVIVCGLIIGDLRPIEEMNAARKIEALHTEGRLKQVTSRQSWREQERSTRIAMREAFKERRDEVSVVQADHRLLGINSQDLGYYGFINSPIITDIIDDDLFAKLKTAGLKDDDAKHVMYAVKNDCHYFVTLDTKDLLGYKTVLEFICAGMRVVKPSEFVAAFETGLAAG